MDNYYQSSEPDLENRFGSIRGQVSYGILEAIRRSRIWITLFSLVSVFICLFALISPYLSALDIEIYETTEVANGLSWASTAFTTGVLCLAGLLFRIASSVKRVALSADAAEVEALLNRMRTFWIIAFLFVLTSLMVWVGLPIVLHQLG